MGAVQPSDFVQVRIKGTVWELLKLINAFAPYRVKLSFQTHFVRWCTWLLNIAFSELCFLIHGLYVPVRAGFPWKTDQWSLNIFDKLCAQIRTCNCFIIWHFYSWRERCSVIWQSFVSAALEAGAQTRVGTVPLFLGTAQCSSRVCTHLPVFLLQV